MDGRGTVGIVYDGFGEGVEKTVDGVTQYLVDDLNPTGYSQVVEELQGGAVTRQYTYGLQRISEYQPISGTWTASFYGYDGGGNVRQLTNAVPRQNSIWATNEPASWYRRLFASSFRVGHGCSAMVELPEVIANRFTQNQKTHFRRRHAPL
ncbi:MAG: hypothetical protein ACLQG3_10255 [Terracidiphilus sp.]